MLFFIFFLRLLSVGTLSQPIWSVIIDDPCIDQSPDVSDDCPLVPDTSDIIRFSTVISNAGDTVSVSDSGDYILRSDGETYGTLCVRYSILGSNESQTMSLMCMRDDTCVMPTVIEFANCTSNVTNTQGLTQDCSIVQERERPCQYVVIPDGYDPNEPIVLRVVIDDLDSFGPMITFIVPLNTTLNGLSKVCATNQAAYTVAAIFASFILCCCLIFCIYYCLSPKTLTSQSGATMDSGEDFTLSDSETYSPASSGTYPPASNDISGMRQRQARDAVAHSSAAYQF